MFRFIAFSLALCVHTGCTEGSNEIVYPRPREFVKESYTDSSLHLLTAVPKFDLDYGEGAVWTTRSNDPDAWHPFIFGIEGDAWAESSVRIRSIYLNFFQVGNGREWVDNTWDQPVTLWLLVPASGGSFAVESSTTLSPVSVDLTDTYGQSTYEWANWNEDEESFGTPNAGNLLDLRLTAGSMIHGEFVYEWHNLVPVFTPVSVSVTYYWETDEAPGHLFEDASNTAYWFVAP